MRKSDMKNAAWGVSPNEGYDVPVEDDERERLLSWQQEHELAALSGGKSTAGDEVPDRVLLKAVEYLESKARSRVGPSLHKAQFTGGNIGICGKLPLVAVATLMYRSLGFQLHGLEAFHHTFVA